MWQSTVYGPHVPVRTPDNIGAWSWWVGGWCPRGSPPRPGSGNQWACTSIRSDNLSKDFIPVPNNGQSTVGYDMEVCATRQGYSPPDHHWPTAKPVMLNDVTGSITFTTASPDSFTPVTCAQCEPALICEENGAPMADLPVLLFSG